MEREILGVPMRDHTTEKAHGGAWSGQTAVGRSAASGLKDQKRPHGQEERRGGRSQPRENRERRPERIAHCHARGRDARQRAPGDRQPDRPVRQEEGQIRARITHQIDVAAVMMRAGRGGTVSRFSASSGLYGVCGSSRT
ncbi:hypothetical protein [Rhodovulum sulfidophilum]|uniref:hypothetical protein n=1 Tax=Rhodovulum sulfidophilum TaxID=35806 RepID=UPI00192310C5|nr:hypothetical protein [Rhodovulum sulfidophilum]MBL3559992.1 hypothetical protein [Rhodovulum sulfidophilum]